ncbi:sodium-coupled neutral amino acid transporter 10 [Lasius niger]|uniref:Sodium-coupled neutral amino acid transporter 10 n=1 Tax=Lasius niger TaxID=67767 RepID=A0A0J7NYJ0_LASNI|nr:sodium-coupled neutral amino acid transporter 10 [Lasius niger]
MISQMSHVMTLANSVIGVSVLAMPFCFKQCGIVLAVLVLLLCSTLSRLACHFLIKSAVISRRRNFELLAFHAFGHMGKFLAELLIIGFMLGTCIAYFVVVGDLGPQIITKMMDKTQGEIRTSLLIVTGVFIVLPLGLLRNIDSLASICTATIVFYLCLVLKIIGESTLHIFAGDWFDSVNYWRPAGILQCLPIFSMALFCQTQLFEIYETIPNVSLEKMNDVVRGALNICTLVYMCVGLFGYIAFCTQSFTVSISLIIGILVPNIEFVLGIVGSTIGVMICLIFPAVFFISISSKNTNERLVAQGILIIGVWIMVLGTYANLYAMEESTNAKLAITNKPLGQINLPLNIIKDDLRIIPDVPNSLELIPRAKDKINKLPNNNVLDKTLDLKVKDVRQEPPIPVERVIVTEKQSVEKSDKAAVDTPVPEKEIEVETVKTLNENLNAQLQGAVNTDIPKIDESVTLKAEEKIKIIEEKERSVDLQKNDNLINLDAIKKEESELAADGDVANARAAERHEELRKTLEKHKLEQRQMMQEQKKILKDIKEQKQEFEREKQRMAKDEILKKSEKKIQINKEDILPESKTDLRENDEKVVENKEISIEEKNKIVLEEKQWNVANKIKINEKQSQDKNNNMAAENSKTKLDSFQEISRNEDVEALQKKTENVPDKSLFIKEVVINREIPERSLHKERQDEMKVERIEFNDSKSMKGPILNVLSKGALQKSIAEEVFAKESDNRQIKEEKREALINGVMNMSEELQGKYDDRYSVPVALKMMNQSKSDKVIVSPSNTSEPESLAIHRDILENNEREKRDVDEEVNVNDTKFSSRQTEKSQSLIKDVNDVDRGTCSKLQEDSKNYEDKKFDKRIIKPSTTEVPLIKTNVYLSKQGITKTISMDPHVAFNVEYVNMKQRDLKVLNPKDNVEI